MRLSTASDGDDARATSVLHAALDAGVTLLDTADVYAPDDRDLGHNERLIARALASWPGDRARVRVATKGGLTRPGGRWVPDGRARHLAAACAASRSALGVERLDLYQLHAPDRRVPLATSVRALAALQRDGWIADIGLCNVSLPQLREALELAPIAAVQVELSPWRDGALRGGLVQECAARGIRLLAYRPFGGVEGARRIGRDAVLRRVAERHGATPWEVTLAWLMALSPVVVPLPGPTQAATGAGVARAATLALDDADRAELDERFPAGRQLREPRRSPPSEARDDSEVVLIIGMPGAGKSTLTAELTARGYARLSRDLRGGRLRDLLPALDALLASGQPGQRRVVLDNTYATRAARNEVLEVAASHGVPVRCLWLTTSLADAQVNVATRMLPGETTDAMPLRPDVLYRYQREFEPPELDEGFAAVESVPFVRRRDPAHTGRALICWLDSFLRRSRSGARAPVSAEDVEIVPGAAELLAGYRREGFVVAGLSWHPEVADGTLSREALDAIQTRTAELLGGDVDLLHCPHGAGPARCWCRKPLPGLGVELIARHRLDPARSIYVGRDATDRSFAAALGFVFRSADEVFVVSD
jgi:aryl-alcohol dehydrogenase-like predicted oxidoreductase/histidinol phosphatase-like enzyme/predicted kinase